MWVFRSSSQNGSAKVSATFSNWPANGARIARRFHAGSAGRELDVAGCRTPSGRVTITCEPR